jgi:hypothetical protein
MTHPSERRSSPRVEMIGQMFGRLASIDRALVVRDISLGGMSIETPVALEAGSVLRFVLTLGDGAGVDVTGRVVRCFEVTGPDGPVFVSGVQFVDDEPDASQVPELLNRIDAPRD